MLLRWVFYYSGFGCVQPKQLNLGCSSGAAQSVRSSIAEVQFLDSRLRGNDRGGGNSGIQRDGRLMQLLFRDLERADLEVQDGMLSILVCLCRRDRGFV